MTLPTVYAQNIFLSFLLRPRAGLNASKLFLVARSLLFKVLHIFEKTNHCAIAPHLPTT
jgi:hypothetical protein